MGPYKSMGCFFHTVFYITATNSNTFHWDFRWHTSTKPYIIGQEKGTLFFTNTNMENAMQF